MSNKSMYVLERNGTDFPVAFFCHQIGMNRLDIINYFTARITEVWTDEIFQECALIQSEPTTVALRLEPIKVLSVIGQ